MSKETKSFDDGQAMAAGAPAGPMGLGGLHLSPTIPQRRDISMSLQESMPDPALISAWHPDGFPTANFYNALSIFFPLGEKFFIHSVRAFEPLLNHKLEACLAQAAQNPEARIRLHEKHKNFQEQIKGFIGQEAMHGREHVLYNTALVKAGYPADKLEKIVSGNLYFVKKFFSPQRQLLITIALEHYTATMAHQILTQPHLLEGALPAFKKLWTWHALEETEHKGVAFDVYQAAIPPTFWNEVYRKFVFVETSIFFWSMVWFFYWRLAFAHLRLPHAPVKSAQWLKFIRNIWGKNGVVRGSLHSLLAYFSSNFHPWQTDDRNLLEPALYPELEHLLGPRPTPAVLP